MKTYVLYNYANERLSQKAVNGERGQVWDGPSEVIYITAEAVPEVDTIWLPSEPVEGGIVTTPVCTESECASLCKRIVRVVDAHERGSQASRFVVDYLQLYNPCQSSGNRSFDMSPATVWPSSSRR